MWYLFFIVGGWWFFALCGVTACLLFWAVEDDSPFWALFTLIGYFALLALFGDFNVLDWLVDHPWKALTYAGGFFAAGTVWSVIKWWFFCRSRRDKYNEKKIQFIGKHSLGIKVTDQIPPKHLKAWHEHMTGYERRQCSKPEPGENKTRIMTWMMYWPWSMVWTLINDPIKKMFKMIYARIQGLYERISNSLFAGVNEEMAAADKAYSQYVNRVQRGLPGDEEDEEDD